MERTPISVFQVVMQVTPLSWAVLALAAAITAGELALLMTAMQRRSVPDAKVLDDAGRRSAARLAIAAAAGPLVLAGAVAASIHAGHARLFAGLAADDPRQNVALIVAGLEGFLNAKLWGLVLLGSAVIIATAAAALHAAAATRSPARPLLVTSLMFVCAGLCPFLIGAFAYSGQLVKLLAGVAGVDPALKRIMVLKGMQETRAVLDGWAAIGGVGFGAALAVGIVFAVKAHRRGGLPGGSWWTPLGLLLAAVALWWAAQPLRAENATPWPASPAAALTINRVATPALEGPDAIPAAEVVTVGNNLLLGNGSPRTAVELHDVLAVMRNNYVLLHPAELPDENLVIVCAPDTKADALIEVLKLAKETEFRRPAFAFGKEETIERPTMGKVRRWRWTAAKALIPGMGPEVPTPVVTLSVRDYPSCDALASAVVGARRAGNIAGLAF